MFPVLLDRIEITGAVVTADAILAQRSHATYLAGRGAHYVLTVKRNQSGLFAQFAALPWRQVPVGCQSRERGHGRAERRTLKITAVAAGLEFPHAAQAIQIIRRRKLPGKKKWSRETVYATTSLTATQASLAELALIIRGHRAIEDQLHWVRDMDWDDDRSQVRTPSAARVMATLRNLGRPPASALRYFPACSHGSCRAKHGLSSHNSSLYFRAPTAAPILAAAAASDFDVVTHT